MKIGIQGSAGSYHESVALNYFDGQADIEYMDTFRHVFDGLKAQTIGKAVVAIANNRYGFVPDAFNELITRHDEVTIVGESYLKVRHQLLGLPGMNMEDIREVHSQAPALGQCQAFLGDRLPHIPLVEQDDTAESARMVAEWQDPTVAAIASAQAGELFGLEVIASDIQDDKDNYTRFLVLEQSGNTTVQEANKTTVLLKTSQQAGSLVDALIPFKERGVNISALHSSFLPNTGFDMQFFLEFDAGTSDPRTIEIFNRLKQQDITTETLGTYVSAVHEMNE